MAAAPWLTSRKLNEAKISLHIWSFIFPSNNQWRERKHFWYQMMLSMNYYHLVETFLLSYLFYVRVWIRIYFSLHDGIFYRSILFYFYFLLCFSIFFSLACSLVPVLYASSIIKLHIRQVSHFLNRFFKFSLYSRTFFTVLLLNFILFHFYLFCRL